MSLVSGARAHRRSARFGGIHRRVRLGYRTVTVFGAINFD